MTERARRWRSAWMWLPLGATVCAAVAALIACAWSWVAWRTHRAALEDRWALVRRYREVATHQPRIESALQAYAGYLATPASDDAAMQQLLGVVEQTAGRAGVQMTSLSPRPSTRTAQASHYTVELECAGTVTALAQFLHALEYAPIVLRTERLRIYPSTAAPQQLESQLRITFITFL